MIGARSRIRGPVRLSAPGLLVLLVCSTGAVAADPPFPPPPTQPRAVLEIMEAELGRNLAGLEDAGEAPLYYLAYALTGMRETSLSASMGGIVEQRVRHDRYLDVDVRVGSMAFDNTRASRSAVAGTWREKVRAPLEDDPLALRTALWERTDRAFRDAQERLAKLKTESRVQSRREDSSADFSPAEPLQRVGEPADVSFDLASWREEVLRWSRRFAGHPDIYRSRVEFSVTVRDYWLVTSEGTRLYRSRPQTRLLLYGWTKAEDGMELYLYETYDAATPQGLPAPEQVERDLGELIRDLEALRAAPLTEPYSGPAILMNRAAGVFLHEVFGHRVEGHRQKREEEGQTFKSKVGQPILPPFLDVYDDPTLEAYRGSYLKGYYRVDDEGVPARRVDLVERGVFRRFLMSRSPIEGQPGSNGHGRRDYGYPPVSRQGNLVIESSNSLSFSALRQRLIEAARKQGKPYGLIFSDISGGFTLTGRGLPQSFKVEPLLVWRVYSDGRPDELVRGVDLVGTPLTSLSKITVTGDDPAIFNGFCGAESGYVPVSAVSPSLLVSEIEVEKKAKSPTGPPALPMPSLVDPRAGGGGDAVLRAMQDELERSLSRLRLEDSASPYHLAYRVTDSSQETVRAAFGSLYMDLADSARTVTTHLRVGDEHFDNTGFVSLGAGASRPGLDTLPQGEDYGPVRHGLWLATDATYRDALSQLAAKRTYVQNSLVTGRPADFSTARPEVRLEQGTPAEPLPWEPRRMVREVSSVFRDRAHVEEGEAHFWRRRALRRLTDSDCALVRDHREEFELLVLVRARAADGAPVSVYRCWRAREASDLPGLEELRAGAREAGEELREVLEAPVGESYVGPVLFTGQAAAGFFAQMLGRAVSYPRPPLMEEDTFARFYDLSGSLTNRLHRRILPEDIQVRDEPDVARWQGHRLLGSYAVDQEGIPGRPLGLVVDGWLRGLPMSRTPTKDLSGSNGHGRAPEGEPVRGTVSSLFVASSAPVPADTLKSRLLTLARRSRSTYALVIQKLHDPALQNRTDPEGLVQQRVHDVELSNPVRVMRFFTDGETERVRGYRFDEMSSRVLKDIAAAGAVQYLWESYLDGRTGDGIPISIVAPDILLEEAVLTPVGGRRSRPYHIPRPRVAPGGDRP